MAWMPASSLRVERFSIPTSTTPCPYQNSRISPSEHWRIWTHSDEVRTCPNASEILNTYDPFLRSDSLQTRCTHQNVTRSTIRKLNGGELCGLAANDTSVQDFALFVDPTHNVTDAGRMHLCLLRRSCLRMLGTQRLRQRHVRCAFDEIECIFRSVNDVQHDQCGSLVHDFLLCPFPLDMPRFKW